MNILILDPANSTGYCVVQVNNNIANITNWGFIDIEPNEIAGNEYLSYIDMVENLIKAYDIEEIAHEDYFFSKFASQGANKNCSFRAMIQMVACKHHIPYTVINISLWKKFINGRTTPTKLQKDQWGKEPAKKLMTQESLWKTWGIKFPNHSLSQKTKKPIKFRYDIVDAVAMAIFYVSIYHRIHNINYNVETIPDHKWKKQPKGIYNYGDI